MEGPYRDLGSGFARLSGSEGARRSPSPIETVEDALRELLRNSRDAGARSIYVASVLRSRRYRTLTVIDDGRGIPETHRESVFEPGVTSRHLDPNPRNSAHGSTYGSVHGAGLSLYHIRDAALSTAVLSASEPTSIQAVFDTASVPERTLQSGSRHSSSNIQATIRSFLHHTPNPPVIYHASPARILATLLKNRIILPGEPSAIQEKGGRMGVRVSPRTAKRIIEGKVQAVSCVDCDQHNHEDHEEAPKTEREPRGREKGMTLGEREKGEIRDILGCAAGARYMEIYDLDFESLPGELLVRARVREAEEEYDG